MSNPLVSINLVVYNGEKYLRQCLRTVAEQSYSEIEVNIWDNASTDATREIVSQEFPQFNLIAHPKNIGTWPGQEAALHHSHGTYVVALSVDVMLDKNFISEAVAVCEKDSTISAVQAKVYQYEYSQLIEGSYQHSTLIDTCGFTLTRGRKVVNIGHGLADSPAFMTEKVLFGVEGAVPFFRRSALEQCRIEEKLVDPDYFWYGDDLDLAWRMTLLGHTQVFAPQVIAWHDRSTTKGSAAVPILGQLARLNNRRAIPLKKRRWDWSNTRFTIIKNDYILNILHDLPYIAVRELLVLGYTVLFEPLVLLEIGRFFKLLPTMLRRRRVVMHRAITPPADIHRFFV